MFVTRRERVAAKRLPRIASACLGWPPTDFTDLHRWFECERSSHRLNRIHRTFCWGWPPTDCTDWHRFVGCVGSPTEFTEFTEPLAWEETNTNNTNNTNEKRPPRNSDAANFRGCTLTSVNSVKSVGESPQQEFLWILWNLWENILSKKFCEFCEICGRIFSAKTSVRSAYSVGDPLLRRRQDTSATMKICGRIYAVSVDSVGGHTITARR